MRGINLAILRYNHFRLLRKFLKRCVINKQSKASAKKNKVRFTVMDPEIKILEPICKSEYRSHPPACKVQYNLCLSTI